MSGASNWTQRTDELVSGSRTHTCTLAVFFAVLAVAPATTIVASTATPARSNALVPKTLFTSIPFCLLGRPGQAGVEGFAHAAARRPTVHHGHVRTIGRCA